MPTGLGDEKLWWVPTHSASVFVDSSSSGHTVAASGTAPTMVTDTDAGGQYAGQFATSGSLWVNDYFQFISAGDHSISGWVKSNSNRITVVGQQTGGIPAGKFGTLFEDTGTGTRAILYRGANGGDTIINAGTSVADNTWHHLCFTRNGSTCTIYIDGTQAVQQTHSGYTTATVDKVLLIGGAWNGGTTVPTSTGYQDDIRVYDRALTQAEITHLATSRGVLGPPGGENYSPFRNAKYINKTYQIPRFG